MALPVYVAVMYVPPLEYREVPLERMAYFFERRSLATAQWGLVIAAAEPAARRCVGSLAACGFAGKQPAK